MPPHATGVKPDAFRNTEGDSAVPAAELPHRDLFHEVSGDLHVDDLIFFCHESRGFRDWDASVVDAGDDESAEHTAVLGLQALLVDSEGGREGKASP